MPRQLLFGYVSDESAAGPARSLQSETLSRSTGGATPSTGFLARRREICAFSPTPQMGSPLPDSSPSFSNAARILVARTLPGCTRPLDVKNYLPQSCPAK